MWYQFWLRTEIHFSSIHALDRYTFWLDDTPFSFIYLFTPYCSLPHAAYWFHSSRMYSFHTHFHSQYRLSLCGCIHAYSRLTQRAAPESKTDGSTKPRG